MDEGAAAVSQPAEAPRVIPWEMRAGLRLPPLGQGLVAAALLLLGALAFRWIFLRSGALETGIGIGFATRAAVIASLAIGYALAAWRWMARGTTRELAGIGLADPEVDPERDATLHAIPHARLRRSRLAGLLGIGFFVLTVEVPNALRGAPLFSTWSRFHAMTYMLALGVGFGWIAGRIAFFSLARLSRFDRLEIDLLDLRPAAALGRIALRRALAWMIGLSIASLVFVNPELRFRDSLIVFLPVALTTLTVAALALFVPLRGVRRRIAAAKREELARIEQALRGDRLALAHSRIAARAADLRLADLIAYQGLVERVREWPLEGSALLRTVLYLLIPLASWLGGALVERALGSLLR